MPSTSFEAKELEQAGIAIDIPRRWRVSRGESGNFVGATGPDLESLTLAKYEVLPQLDAGYGTDRALEVALSAPVEKPERLDDVELLGVEMFHLRGRISDIYATEWYGGFVGEEEYLELRLDQRLSKPAAKRDRLAAEIVSTLRTVDGQPLG